MRQETANLAYTREEQNWSVLGFWFCGVFSSLLIYKQEKP